jgi:hypothetical protein
MRNGVNDDGQRNSCPTATSLSEAWSVMGGANVLQMVMSWRCGSTRIAGSQAQGPVHNGAGRQAQHEVENVQRVAT